MSLSKESFDEWKEHPVTKEIFKEIKNAVEHLKLQLSEGATISFSAEETHGKTNYFVGQIEGLNQLLNISFEE